MNSRKRRKALIKYAEGIPVTANELYYARREIGKAIKLLKQWVLDGKMSEYMVMTLCMYHVVEFALERHKERWVTLGDGESIRGYYKNMTREEFVSELKESGFEVEE